MAAKTKVVKDKEMSDMFNQMLGTGDSVNLAIVYPKYCQMEGYSNSIVDIIEKFAKSPFMARYGDTHNIHIQEILKYCSRSREQIATVYEKKIPKEYEWNPELVDDETKKEFAAIYTAAKTHEVTSGFINLCDRLIKYRRYLAEEDKVNHKFILNMPDIEFNPFPFSPTLNIKGIFMSMESEKDSYQYLPKEERMKAEHVNAQLCSFCMLVLHKLYKISYNLYKVMTSPDIDVDEFVNVIVSSIDQIKSQPNLSRCNRAFDKIKESVHMLKDNFSEYYKDFLETKNSTIIMENFVIDVSKNTKSDPQLMQQFRKIISHYRSLAKNNIQNPQLRALFDRVNEQFSRVDESHPNIVEVEKGKTTEYIDPDDAAREEQEAQERKLEEERAKEEEAAASNPYRKQQEKNANKSVEQLLKEMGINPESDGKSKKGKKK